MCTNLTLNKERLYLIAALLILPESASCSCKSAPVIKEGFISETAIENGVCPCARGGVVSNTPLSAEVGREILERGGSAVDAAIATLFSEGVMLPHATGIGGSFLMTIYDYKSRIVKTLNARGTAPSAATVDMFEGCAGLAQKGGLSVCVPGLIRGCWYAHREYGILPWSELLKPAAHSAKHGFKVTPYLESIFFTEQKQIQDDESFRELYVDPNTKRTYKIGETIRNATLGKTLKLIGEQGESAFYDGELTEKFVNDVQSINGVITIDDMKDYIPLWGVPLSTTLPGDLILYTVNTPGCGAILILMLNIMNGCLDLENIDTIPNWHNIVEGFKFGFGARSSLGDGIFEAPVNLIVDTITSKIYASSMRNQITFDTHQEPEYYGANFSNAFDHNGSNIVVFSPEGDAVVVTSTLNQDFGAGTLSKSTGIILNNEMNDFSIPNMFNQQGQPSSSANFIAPGKRPISSMAPSVILDKHGNVVFGIGASGGPKATSGIALVTLRHLFFKESITKAVAARRISHQLCPMHIMAETGFSEKILKSLMRRKHDVEIKIPDGLFAVTAMSKGKKGVIGSFDPRRGGQVELTY